MNAQATRGSAWRTDDVGSPARPTEHAGALTPATLALLIVLIAIAVSLALAVAISALVFGSKGGLA